MSRDDALPATEQQKPTKAQATRAARRWPDVPTQEVAAALVRPGWVLTDESGKRLRVTAVGTRPELVVLYLATDDDTVHVVPSHRVRLGPSDTVLVPATRTRGGLPFVSKERR